MRLMQNFTLISVVCVVCDMNEVFTSYMCFLFVLRAWGHGAWEEGGVSFSMGVWEGVFFFSFFGRNMMTCSLYMS